jgi:hypothetical protein
MTAAPQVTPGTVQSLIPARIDRLPWSSFHTRMVVALGVAWILDGLEIQIATAISAVLNQRDTLNLSSTAVGLIATVYLVGEVVGALVFGRMSDKLGRRNLFMITLGRLPGGQRSDRADSGQRCRLGRLFVHHPLHRRHGHRRGVRGDQLRDRRADPGSLPREGGYRGQRHVLGGRGAGHIGHIHSTERVESQYRLADRFPDRTRAGTVVVAGWPPGAERRGPLTQPATSRGSWIPTAATALTARSPRIAVASRSARALAWLGDGSRIVIGRC